VRGWFAALCSLFLRDDERLFRYWDGARWRRIDPIKAHRGIWRDEKCDLLSDSPITLNPRNEDGSYFYPAADVIAAEDRIRDLVCRVFDVKEWTEQRPGLTCLELDELLNSFILYCDELKKKRSVSRTSSAPSTPPDVLPFSAGSDSPPPNAPDSSCTPSASTAGVPTGP
jgi:hypothetical protein